MQLIAGAKKAAARRGRGRTAFYDDIKRGLMTTPILNGARAVVWPLDEIESINKARVAGLDDDQIRVLVARLHAERAIAAGDVVGKTTANPAAVAKSKTARADAKKAV